MRRKLIAGLTGAALAVGVGLGITQFAQADTSSPTPRPSATAFAMPRDVMPGHGMGHQRQHDGRDGADLSSLATKLGVDETTLADAWATAREATRPEHSSALPRTQAGRESARTEHQRAMVKVLASELGIDESKVATAMSELQAEAQAARTATPRGTLDQAVTDGTLTQTEADAVQKAIDAGIVSPRGGRQGHR